jgi:hypothetical protein
MGTAKTGFLAIIIYKEFEHSPKHCNYYVHLFRRCHWKEDQGGILACSKTMPPIPHTIENRPKAQLRDLGHPTSHPTLPKGDDPTPCPDLSQVSGLAVAGAIGTGIEGWP